MTQKRRIQILIVEDSVTVRLAAVGVVKESLDWEVVQAGDGAKAWALIQESPPDIVLSDFKMPEMTGLELLLAMRKNSDLANIPFVLMSGDGAITESQAMEAGCTAFIAKPFVPAELPEFLASLI